MKIEILAFARMTEEVEQKQNPMAEGVEAGGVAELAALLAGAR